MDINQLASQNAYIANFGISSGTQTSRQLCSNLDLILWLHRRGGQSLQAANVAPKFSGRDSSWI